MKKWVFALVGAGIVAAVGCSAAARADGFYLGGEAGWTALQDQHDRNGGSPTVRKGFSAGFVAGARGGYQWGPWRFEEEYSYRGSDLNHLALAGTPIPGSTGSRNSHAIMTNVIYDLNVGWPVTPHIGAGIGAVDIVESASAPGTGRIADDNDWQFGYQAIAGVGYNLSPDLTIDLDYRYLATTDPHFRTVTGVPYKSGYETHNVMASLIYRFAPPPPPPVMTPAAAPAPAPAPTRKVFLVFFDWDRDTITPEGMQIVRQAADAYKAGAAVQIQVTGYTDRSGSPAYNQRLSERRANNVAGALARLGVPRDQMAVSGRGENDNRVPTADGVREPQNRRVEILFS
jgi:outer membrane protein OmpA-like peptidoglycan-associated protein